MTAAAGVSAVVAVVVHAIAAALLALVAEQPAVVGLHPPGTTSTDLAGVRADAILIVCPGRKERVVGHAVAVAVLAIADLGPRSNRALAGAPAPLAAVPDAGLAGPDVGEATALLSTLIAPAFLVGVAVAVVVQVVVTDLHRYRATTTAVVDRLVAAAATRQQLHTLPVGAQSRIVAALPQLRLNHRRGPGVRGVAHDQRQRGVGLQQEGCSGVEYCEPGVVDHQLVDVEHIEPAVGQIQGAARVALRRPGEDQRFRGELQRRKQGRQLDTCHHLAHPEIAGGEGERHHHPVTDQAP